MLNQKKIAVHSGTFHADDVFSVACLTGLMEYSGAEIVRTRDPEVLAGCDIRVDVGGELNPNAKTFDHHQRGGAGERANGIPYAGFGLIWDEFGRQLLKEQFPMIADEDLDEVWEIVDERLVQQVDAGDCGFSLATEWAVEGCTPYTISHLISALNPSWNGDQSPAAFARQFEHAVEGIARPALDIEIQRACDTVDANVLARKALADAEDKRVVILERFHPWGDVLIEETDEAQFVVFANPDGEWMVQAIPPEKGSFAQRTPLPASWAGKRGEELSALLDLPGSIFVHPGRFIGGHKTREGAIRMAEMALKLSGWGEIQS